MKKTVAILALMITLKANSQNEYPKLVNDNYQPIEVLRVLKNDFSDSAYVLSTEKTVFYQNYKYVYSVWETGRVVNARLVKKEKLFSRWDYIKGKRKA